MDSINILLFDNFTMLDALGPAEVFGRLQDVYTIGYFSRDGGLVRGSAGVKINTEPASAIKDGGVLLVPGGFGTRALVSDTAFLALLADIASKSRYVLTVCTGSALLAKTGLLDGKKATSNKKSWDWVIAQRDAVQWIRHARWTVDGKFYTSSGITAGIDMALAFAADTAGGTQKAQEISSGLEYVWNSNKDFDPFC